MPNCRINIGEIDIIDTALTLRWTGKGNKDLPFTGANTGKVVVEVVEVVEVVVMVMTAQVLIGVPLGGTILTVIGPISFCPKQMSCQSLWPCCPGRRRPASPGQAGTSSILAG